MSAFDPTRYPPGAQFRHDKGGSWEIVGLDGDKLTIKPMPGTNLKPKGLLLWNNFKIFGTWFKIVDVPPGRIVLQRKLPRHDPV